MIIKLTQIEAEMLKENNRGLYKDYYCKDNGKFYCPNYIKIG